MLNGLLNGKNRYYQLDFLKQQHRLLIFIKRFNLSWIGVGVFVDFIQIPDTVLC